eukprot:TRINITY_DN107512_c0_g1_i1.p1 TRINITY_DN107512_c0_g1~~TRINITY_DN107512_c0_g1_i1.p1  ORF type:complete len:383 (-),score=72.84 TRINITY_DN107512_c0_g1_i1:53-1201(-)
MVRELELVQVSSVKLGQDAEVVIATLFEALVLKFEHERERMERANTLRQPSAKWNKQELYLQPQSRARAIAASRHHLQRHPEWWLAGKAKLSRDQLQDIVALQHHLWIDLEDLALKPEERRSEDVFVGSGDDICEQLFLDAPRSVFEVDGQEFNFAKELRESHPELDVKDVEPLRSSFCDRVVEAIKDCLGGDPPRILLQAVTTVMSQSGIANLEQACLAPQVAVSGGDQQLRFVLRRIAQGGPWDLELLIRKEGFDQCIVYRQLQKAAGMTDVADEEDAVPVACSPLSFFAKSCRIRYSVVSSDGDVRVDTLALSSEHHLLDENGKALPGFGSSKPSACHCCAQFHMLARMAGRAFRSYLGACGRLCARRIYRVRPADSKE